VEVDLEVELVVEDQAVVALVVLDYCLVKLFHLVLFQL
jgi:hypothetical protein